MKRISIFLALAASALHAAIITERNDDCDWEYIDIAWNGKAGCIPPPPYTFVGTSSRPGIDSCWIPYGTYTDGTGGTEYTRVTSNLMGVVASALGGAKERWSAIGGTAYIVGPGGGEVTDEQVDMYGMPIFRPMDWDGTMHVELEEYLASTTNLSFRISDQLNRGILLCQGYDTDLDVIYDSNIALEPLLACTRAVIDYKWGWYTNYFYNGGILGRFGSRRLEEMIGSVPPPISTSWSSNIIFNVAATSEWARVWPVFSACTNDIHFFPVEGEHRYPHVLPGYGSSWGDDVFEAHTNLWHVLSRIPYNITVEDVLSADTGWKYEYPPRLTNDYWTVNGIQLDRWYCEPSDGWSNLNHSSADWEGADSNQWYAVAWNRDSRRWQYAESSTGVSIFVDASPNAKQIDFGNGIIATKTEFYADTDDYVHWRNMTTRLDWKRLGIICQLERQMEITYEQDTYEDLPAKEVFASHVKKYYDTVNINLPLPELGGEESYRIRDLNPSWTQYDESRSISSNYWGTSSPTCRLPAPTVGGNATIIGTDLMQALHIDDGVIENMMTNFAESASLTDGVHNIVLTGHWTPVDAFSVRYHVDQATEWDWVEHPSNTVSATINGQRYSKTGSYPIAGNTWDISQQNPILVVAFPPQGGTTIGLSLNIESGREELEVFEMAFEGDLDNGSCMIPSIALTASGDGDFTNWVWQADGGEFTYNGMSIEPDGVAWDWEDDQGGYLWLWYMFDDTQGYGNEAFCDANHMYWYAINIEGHPQYISSPQGSVEWESHTYRRWEPVKTWTSGIPDYDVGFKYDVTNEDVRVTLNIHKYARGIWTYLDDHSMYPDYLPWDDRILYQEYPTVQGLLYDRGPHSCESDYDLYWDDIKDYGGAGRLFRMSPRSSDRAQTKAQARFVLAEITRSLDKACKDRCVELGGPDPRVLSEFGKLTTRDVADVKDDIGSADITARYVIEVANTNFVVSATVDVHDGEGGVPEITVSDCQAGYGEASSPPAFVCNYGWTFSTAGSASTNINESVRADGSQVRIKRTLWKFKNLRDPNL